ncbi:LysR family transcriptional regulator [Aliidiomarina sp. Khilg15.8]
MRDWQGISEFVAVAEQGSFTRAAAQLNMSIAQVSRNVSELEQRLTVKLLYRSTRRVNLTEEGRLYLQHCRLLVQGLDEANRTMGDLKANPQGLLKITAPVYFGEQRIAPLLNDFLLTHADIEVDLLLSNSRLDLIQGSFDLAIRLGNLEDSSLIAKRLGARTHYIVGAPAYFARHGVPQTPDALSEHSLLAGTLDHWRLQVEGKQHSVRPGGRVRCNSGLALLDAASKGLGLAQLPGYYVQEKLERGDLCSVLDAYRPADDGIWALYPQNRHLSAKVRAVVDFLQRKL